MLWPVDESDWQVFISWGFHVRFLIFHRLVAVVILLSALLSGCESVNVAADPLKHDLSSSESVVAISVTGNTSRVNGFDTMSVRKVQNDPGSREEFYVLGKVAPGLSRDTSLFV